MGTSGKYGQLLRNRRFLLFEASSTTSSVGYSVFALSVPWLTLALSGSFAVVGLALFVEYGVYALTFCVAPWVDRARDKRTVFLVCFPLQAVAAAVLGVTMQLGSLTVPLLLGLIGLISFLWDFAWAAQNVAPRLLLEPDELFRGAGVGGVLAGASQIAGYAAGGILLVVIGPAGGMYLYALLLAVSAALAALVALPSPTIARARRYFDEFREGWRYFGIRVERSLLGLGSVELIRGFFTAAPALLITLVATRVFFADPSAYSLLFVAWVVGGVAVGLLLGELNPRHRIGWILSVSMVSEGLLVGLVVAFAPNLAVSAVLWSLLGFAGAAYLTVEYTYLRAAFPGDALGRITSNLYVFTGVSAAAGALVLGQLAESWPLVAFGALVGAGLLLVGVLIWILPSVRRLAF